MSDFDAFLEAVKNGVTNLAKQTLKDGVDDAKADLNDFEIKAKEDWKRWTVALANGQMSQSDFEGLLKGQAALAQMEALTAAGIAAARIQRFRDAVINIVIDSAFKVFLKV